MAAWRYEISLLVLKKYFTSERSELCRYISSDRSVIFCKIIDLFSFNTKLDQIVQFPLVAYLESVLFTRN